MYKKIVPKLGLIIGLCFVFHAFALAQQQDAEVFVQLGHSFPVSDVAFSPDGKFAVSAGNDKNVILWDIETGSEIRSFEGVAPVGFTPDGSRILAVFKEDIKMWDLYTGEQIHTFETNNEPYFDLSFAITPDSRHLIVGDSNGEMKQWSINTGENIRTFDAHNKNINSLAFTSDGDHIISGSSDNIIKLWETDTGKLFHTFETGEQLHNVTFSPDGQLALSQEYTSDEGSQIKVWGVVSGDLLRTISTTKDISEIAFLEDGQRILSAGKGVLEIWNTKTGDLLKTVSFGDGFTDQMRAVAFSPDGKYMLHDSYESQRTLTLRKLTSGKKIRKFRGIRNVYGSNIAVSPDGRYMANAVAEPELWDLSTGRLLHTFSGNESYVFSVAFSPDGRYVLSGSDEDTLKLWQRDTGQLIRTLSGRSSSMMSSVKFSPDGKFLLSGSYGMRLSETDTGREIHTFNRDSTGRVTSVAFSMDGKYILSGSFDGSVKLWDAADGELVHDFMDADSESPVESVTFSPDGRYVLSGGWDDHNIRLWEASTGREVRSIQADFKIFSIAFSPDGKLIAGSGHDNRIQIWETSTGLLNRTLNGHRNLIRDVAFSPDGHHLISTSQDRTTRIWDVGTGRELVQFVADNSGNWVALTPEGYYNSSKNGADLLNVRIGNKVYSMDNFFETYYRPDIVKAKLAGEDIAHLIEDDIREETSQPPELTIVSPESGQTPNTEEVTVRVQTIDQGGGVDEVRLYHNGKLVQTTNRGFKVSGTNTKEFQVQLVPGENILEATAFNDDRIESNRDRLTVNYHSTQATVDLYILGIGINDYKNESLNLNYGRPDAEAFTQAIQNQSDDIFNRIHLTTLYDQQATRNKVISAFESIIDQVVPQDVFLLYYAGHGVMSDPEGNNQADFYMALHETIRLYGDEQGLMETGISASEMTELTRRIAARKQMVVLDACQSGGAVETFAMRGAAEQKAIIQLARSAGLVVMASTGTEQFATEFDALGHGVFTYALLNGLSGEADGGSRDGKITIKELEAFINDQVPELTQEHRGQSQYPNSYARGQDFPIVIVN